jgi:decaprenylphospho-beta-D-ribofuranose 2-oxidase
MSEAAARVFHSLGFGEHAQGLWDAPDRYRFFDSPDLSLPLIPQGAGLSLAGAGFGEGVKSVGMCRFDRILAFDPACGIVTVEAGITLGRLFEFLAPHGWQVAVQPGHPDITVGGCIGANVHGKNPLSHGCFGRWVDSLVIAHPDHGRLTLSADQSPDLLELTIGGFGLTGWILTATLRLVPLSAGPMRIEPMAVDSLEAAATILAKWQGEVDQLYSWHDMAWPGRRGGGLVFLGKVLDSPPTPTGLDRYVPLDQQRRALPLGVMNRLGIGLINRVQSWRWRKPKEMGAGAATFPFAATPEYFYLYGRRGFIEHQTLIPWPAAESYLGAMRRLLDRHRVTPGLMVLKPFGGQPGLLRFEGEGLGMALEAARGEATSALFADLDALDREHGAKPNIIKDARLPAEAVAAAYGAGYDEFRCRLEAFDPKRRMRSALSQRIGL